MSSTPSKLRELGGEINQTISSDALLFLIIFGTPLVIAGWIYERVFER